MFSSVDLADVSLSALSAAVTNSGDFRFCFDNRSNQERNSLLKCVIVAERFCHNYIHVVIFNDIPYVYMSFQDIQVLLPHRFLEHKRFWECFNTIIFDMLKLATIFPAPPTLLDRGNAPDFLHAMPLDSHQITLHRIQNASGKCENFSLAPLARQKMNNCVSASGFIPLRS